MNGRRLGATLARPEVNLFKHFSREWIRVKWGPLGTEKKSKAV